MLAAAVWLAPSAHGSTSLLGPGDHSESITVGPWQRSYIVHVPPGPYRANRPLILVYHGAGGTSSATEDQTDFAAAADSAGDVVVFLQGVYNTWDDFAGHTPAEVAHVDDVGYTVAVLNALVPLVEYNRARVAAAGLSNGAIMVETLGCRLAGRLHLIVPVEGQLATAVSPGCAPLRPLNVIEVHGTADPSIPYGGGVFHGVGGPVSVLSAPASVARWAALDGCRSHASSPAHAGLALTHYTRCRGGVSVTLRTIVGGLHVWGAHIGTVVTGALAH